MFAPCCDNIRRYKDDLDDMCVPCLNSEGQQAGIQTGSPEPTWAYCAAPSCKRVATSRRSVNGFSTKT